MENTTHHYLDINILNNSQYDTSVPLVFSQTRTDNLIENASEYDLSIIRFSINSPILPLMSAKIDINQQDVNILKIGFKCIWSIFLNNDPTENKTKWVEMPLYFETQDKTIVQPTYPYNKGHFSDLYFNIHNFQQFINMLNLAIYKASILLDTPINGVLPKFEIEPTSNRVILTYNPSTFITKTKCQIAFNGPLHSMLNGFNFSKLNIFTPEQNLLFERKTIKLPPQYKDYFFNNVIEHNGLFLIEGGAPSINILRDGKEMNQGAPFRTYMLVDQNKGSFEVSALNPEFYKVGFSNMSISESIVGILENQYHRLYYNSVYLPLAGIIYTKTLGTSSNHLIKGYNPLMPFEPIATNNDVNGFINIVFYRTPTFIEAENTVITCVDGDFVARRIYDNFSITTKAFILELKKPNRS